jgi:cell division protein FtsQ
VNFWSNTRLLNMASNALFALTAVLMLLAAGHALVRSPAFALRAIEVTGDLEHVRRSHVVGVLQGHVSGTFFTADLDALRGRFESIPWVRRAEVRRSWPDRLVVRLEEHTALARWGDPEDGRLVSVRGEPFNAFSPEDLPLFAGPEGTERLVAGRYAEFRSALAPLGSSVTQVLLSDRLAWQVRLASGLVLQLGREGEGGAITERLARFVEAYPRTVARLETKAERSGLSVDLRYPNGFAVRGFTTRTAPSERITQGRDARRRA